MTHPIWNRETLLDSLVNIVPLGIIAFFTVLFLVASPWAVDSFLGTVVSMGLLLVPFVLLAIVTYFTARVI